MRKKDPSLLTQLRRLRQSGATEVDLTAACQKLAASWGSMRPSELAMQLSDFDMAITKIYGKRVAGRVIVVMRRANLHPEVTT